MQNSKPVSVSFNLEQLTKLDSVRKHITRSEAVKKFLNYLLMQDLTFLNSLLGILDNTPRVIEEDYKKKEGLEIKEEERRDP